jgi:hypothetical protein
VEDDLRNERGDLSFVAFRKYVPTCLCDFIAFLLEDPRLDVRYIVRTEWCSSPFYAKAR